MRATKATAPEAAPPQVGIPAKHFKFPAKVVRVVDGDTIDLILDLGFKIYHKVRTRLYCIDTPEVRTRDKEEKVRGLAAKDRVKEFLPEGKECIFRSYEIGKYGRAVGDIEFNFDNVNYISLCQTLIDEGHAEKVAY